MGIGYDLAGGGGAESAGSRSLRRIVRRHEIAMKKGTMHVLPARTINQYPCGTSVGAYPIVRILKILGFQPELHPQFPFKAGLVPIILTF